MTTETNTPSTRKVRRELMGGKRGVGHANRRVARRADPMRTVSLGTDRRLTGSAGLLAFGGFLKREGVDRWLTERFARLKVGRNLVYPMGFQLRLMVDLLTSGETRPFGVEGKASDALFQHLCGHQIPSVDTLYDDLARFDDEALAELEGRVAAEGMRGLAQLRTSMAHLDVDTTVLALAGEHEGGRPGPNPKYHGRPSFHPLLARIAETNMLVGGQLRPGDTAFGEGDTATLKKVIVRTRRELRKGTNLCVRIDAAADCAAILKAIHDAGAFFLVKARFTADVVGAFRLAEWTTVDRDADGTPLREVAEIDFRRASWDAYGLPKVRVIVVQSRDRQGKQLDMFGDGANTAQMFLTNRYDEDADDVAWDYDGRAGIEPLIAELKNSWGIGDATGFAFAANHALFLLKLLSYNLLRRYVARQCPEVRRWRTPWMRRVFVNLPGRLVCSARKHRLLIPPRSPLVATL